ncbi:MAG: hypothetical protein LBK58_09555 [Prevotellaceae bacterium]|jgi:hypothetical protein|nr:hypothetical protein [Prevotellaceae bacterium]
MLLKQQTMLKSKGLKLKKQKRQAELERQAELDTVADALNRYSDIKVFIIYLIAVFLWCAAHGV